MKNIKNTLAAITLASVLGLGSVSANAGMLLSDRSINSDDTRCTVTKGDLFSQLSGIIIIGAPQAISGMLLSDRPTPACEQTDRNGMLLSDRNGMLLSD